MRVEVEGIGVELGEMTTGVLHAAPKCGGMNGVRRGVVP